jgi:membrane protease YdiL (CAAX protease family)
MTIVLEGSDFGPPRPREASPAEEVTWGPRQLVIGLVGAVFTYILAVFLVGAPVQLAFGEESTEGDFGALASTIVGQIGSAALIYRIVLSTGGTWHALGLRPTRDGKGFFSPRLIGQAFGASIVARLLIVVYLLFVMLSGLEWLEPDDQIPEDFLDQDVLLPLIGISLIFTAPFSEELLFRGFVFGGLRRYLPFWPAALIPGALFSAAHFQVGLFIPFLAIGVLFAYVYEKTNSLYMSIMTHLLFNLVSFVLLIFVA